MSDQDHSVSGESQTGVPLSVAPSVPPSATSSATSSAESRPRRWFAAPNYIVSKRESRVETSNSGARDRSSTEAETSRAATIAARDVSASNIDYPPAMEVEESGGASPGGASPGGASPGGASPGGASPGGASVGSAFAARFSTEDEREVAYQAELLELFRVRLRLVAALTMLALPIFMLLQITLASGVENMLVVTYSSLFALCIFTRIAARRMARLDHIRLLSLLAYSLFCLGSGLIVSLMGNRQIYILGGHNHIVLTVLLLPYTMWECLAIGLIAIAALAWSGWWALFPQQSHLYFSHLFVLSTTTVFVVIIAHFQSALHRRAFDTAFDLRQAARRLQTLSFQDALTDGFNRRYFETVLETEIARAIRFERPLSIMMFDLDNFKAVNDTRGHACGDEVLREVWQGTMATIREVDSAARYGGDEFAIVLPETDEAAAHAIAQRLQEITRDALHARFGADSRESQVTLSIGITTTRLRETVPFQTLIEHTDQRLYAAKRNGKNNIAM